MEGQPNPSPVPQTRPLRYRRIVAKAGTTLLTGGTERLNLGVMASLVSQIGRLHRRGAQVLLVSSGAVAAGRHALGITDAKRRDTPFRQVLAAVGQSKLMHAWEQLFAWEGITVAQALLTRRDTTDRLSYLNIRNTLLALLDLRVVPILNENDVVAVEELEGEVFGDNDTLSALVATIVDADLLVLLSDVPGLFTADPHLHPDARLIPRVEDIDEEVLAMAGGSASGRGRGGMVTKLEAARLCTAAGTGVVICHGQEPEVLVRLAEGESIGTFFPPRVDHRESRQRWLLGACSPKDAVVIDAGAVEALRQHKSLLPVGVIEVRGDFARGEVISILGPDGKRVAVGIANYSAPDLRRIQGKRSDRIASLLGYTYGQEVVHSNNMALL
ncbi:MAG: glutamate 5-kinase [Dehalococcoidia bacterium]|nr:glutamate 5-kinase [Dehalococcoidia bacterium]MDW8119492.1 glutamate 5-kinase [Chloroflexota bacterium]